MRRLVGVFALACVGMVACGASHKRPSGPAPEYEPDPPVAVADAGAAPDGTDR